MISKWRHPIKYLRLVTTPACNTCCHFARGLSFDWDKCTCKKYLEHINRLGGTRYDRANVGLVRGTRWCDFEPIEEDAEEEK